MTSNNPENIEEQLRQLLGLGGQGAGVNPNGDSPRTTAAKAELVALGNDIDADMVEYMKAVQNWGKGVKEKFNLSEDALCVLMGTAPSGHDCWHADLSDKAVATSLELAREMRADNR